MDNLGAVISEKTDKKDIWGPTTMVSPAISKQTLESEADLTSLRGKNILITGGLSMFAKYRIDLRV